MEITLIYASESCIDANFSVFLREIENIRDCATANNAREDITGFLFYYDSRFIQILEGEFDAVTNLFSRIKRDARHKKVKLCYLAETTSRDFEDWAMDASMAFFGTHHSELSIKLKFLNRFIEDTNPQPIMLKSLLVSVAVELTLRPEFPRPRGGDLQIGAVH